MDNFTLVIINALITLVFMTIILALALLRKDKSLYYFTMTFAFGALGALLLSRQGIWPRLISIIFYNLTLFLTHTLFSVGFRSFFQLKPFPRRFWIYMAGFMLLISLFTYIQPSYSARKLISFMTLTVVLIDFYIAIRKIFKTRSQIAAVGLRLIILIELLFYGVFGVAQFFAKSQSASAFYDTSQAIKGVYIMQIVSHVIWAAAILIIDNDRLMSDLKQKNQKLADIAFKDPLTGLYTRYYLDNELDFLIDNARHREQPLSLILFDLDNFKKINDTFGHDVGDSVLRQVSDIFKGLTRKQDVLCRWGGEEILLVMPDTKMIPASIIAKKMGQTLAETIFPKVGKVTVSGGVAEYEAKESLNTLFKRVDEALYLAKENGRNRVVTSNKQVHLTMPLVQINWHAEWESGNQEIDRQRREMTEMTNRLMDVSLAGMITQETLQIVDLLLERMTDLFSCEKEKLAQIGFPGSTAHVAKHQRLATMARQLEDAYRSGEIKLSDLFDFVMNEVVLGHFLEDDVLYFPFLSNDR